MIRMTVEISEINRDVSVHVYSTVAPGAQESEAETMIGLCAAINEYMRSCGVSNFDCLQKVNIS